MTVILEHDTMIVLNVILSSETLSNLRKCHPLLIHEMRSMKAARTPLNVDHRIQGDEQVYYYDVCSEIFVFVNEIKCYPIGHPKKHQEFFQFEGILE